MRKRKWRQQIIWAELCVFLKPSASETKAFSCATPMGQTLDKLITQTEKKWWESLNVLSPTLQDKSMVAFLKKVLAHQKLYWNQTRHQSSLIISWTARNMYCMSRTIRKSMVSTLNCKDKMEDKTVISSWGASTSRAMGIHNLVVRQIFVGIWIYFPHPAHPARGAESSPFFHVIFSTCSYENLKTTELSIIHLCQFSEMWVHSQ